MKFNRRVYILLFFICKKIYNIYYKLPTISYKLRIRDERNFVLCIYGNMLLHLCIEEVEYMRTDLEIVKLVLDGEFTAFEEILNRYQIVIYRFICNNIKDKESAKDLCQETFISAYYKLYTYNQKYKFSSWLYQIALNKSIDYFRKNKRKHSVELTDYTAQDYISSPEVFAEYKETKREIEGFIKTLKEVDRQILTLKYSNEDITFREISEILKLSESTVKHKYYKIYDKYEKYIHKEKEEVSCYEL